MYPDLTVAENLDFFATIRGVSPPARRERAASLLESMGLGEFADRQAQHLSGGMKQKLMLATTLMHEPDLLLLDEPTTGVDPVSRREFWRIIAALHRAGKTVLVATPYMDEAERCTDIAFMTGGRILHRGTPAEVKSLVPGNLFEVSAPDPRAVLADLEGSEGIASAHLLGEYVRVLVDAGRARRRRDDRAPERGWHRRGRHPSPCASTWRPRSPTLPSWAGKASTWPRAIVRWPRIVSRCEGGPDSHRRHRAQGVHPPGARPAHPHRGAHHPDHSAAALRLRHQLRRQERADGRARPGQDRRQPAVPADVHVVGLLRRARPDRAIWAASTASFDRNQARIAVVVPSGFARSSAAGEKASVAVLVDGSEPNSAQLGQAYAVALNQTLRTADPCRLGRPAGTRLDADRPARAQDPDLVQPRTPVLGLPDTGAHGGHHHDRHDSADGRDPGARARPGHAGADDGQPAAAVGADGRQAAAVDDPRLRRHGRHHGGGHAASSGCRCAGACPSSWRLPWSSSSPLLASDSSSRRSRRALESANITALLVSFLPGFILSGFAFPLESIPPFLQMVSYAVPGALHDGHLARRLPQGRGLRRALAAARRCSRVYAVAVIVIASVLYGRRAR